jgi:hypothetical protein
VIIRSVDSRAGAELGLTGAQSQGLCDGVLDLLTRPASGHEVSN